MNTNHGHLSCLATYCAALILLAPSGFVLSAASAQTSSDTVVGPGGSSTQSTTTPPSQPAIVLPAGPASNIGAAWLADDVKNHLGRPVDHLAFIVTNKNRSPIEYDFSDGQQFDIVVNDSNGKEVWTWSKGRRFSPLVTHLDLKSGQSHTFDVVWNRRDDDGKPVAPGTYTAYASLLPMPRLVVAQSTLIDPTVQAHDPTNVNNRSAEGMAHDNPRSGEEQSDITPGVTAKTTIVIPDTAN